jgi:hypothetical protein
MLKSTHQFNNLGKIDSKASSYDAMVVRGASRAVTSFVQSKTSYGCLYSVWASNLHWHPNGTEFFYTSGGALVHLILINDDIYRIAQRAYCIFGTDSGVNLSDDGVTIIGTGSGRTNSINSATLATPWKLPDTTNVSVTKTVAITNSPTDISNVDDCRICNNGTKLFISCYTNGEMPTAFRRYDLGTPYDINSIDFTPANIQEVDMTAKGEMGQMDFRFSPDGLHLYVNSYWTYTLNHYTLSTAWDLSTMSGVVDTRAFGDMMAMKTYRSFDICPLNRRMLWGEPASPNSNLLMFNQ